MATIMVVEDHAMSRQFLVTLLSSLGHSVLPASDGDQALRLATEEHLDLIITDILLPTMDGVDLVRRLRAEAGLADTPVIFYTASSRHPKDLRVDDQCGPCWVIEKPSEPDVIMRTVNRLLQSGTGVSASVVGRLHGDSRAGLLSEEFGMRFPVLMDLSYSMLVERDPDALLDTVSRMLRELLGCSHSLLMVQMADGVIRNFHDYSGTDLAVSSLVDWLYSSGTLRRVVDDRLPLRRTQGTGMSGYPCEHGFPTEFESLLLVPFASPSDVYGLICLVEKQAADSFSEVDEEIAVTLGAQAALAYENILLVERLQQSEKYLEDLVEQRTAELRRANDELLKAQKLESLGVLAGGIAHDFNNALTVILNLIQLIKANTKPQERNYRYLQMAEKSCHDVKALTGQLLTFAKGGTPLKKAARLPDLLYENAQFSLRGSNVRCEFSLSPDLCVVEIDQGQISQVIGNLLINADQAMPDGGTIRIQAQNVQVSESDSLPLKSGRYVEISVSDQGVGIPPEDLHRIFDPYFTTKEAGNGLGLATAYSIINKHDGCILVDSQPGAGTTFRVYLPASDSVPVEESELPELAVVGGRILLIDDQAAIASSLAELLGINGYQVDFVADGSQALPLYRQMMQRGSPYDVVITDLTIPGGMGGKETIRRLLELDPAAKVVVSSGYSNDPLLSDYSQYGFCGAVSKPYRIDELLRELQRIQSR
jgi:signal transduction histidine kinase/DNA-binding response OmpR family regulator